MKNWFNEYQEVEDFIIQELGEEYAKLDFSKTDQAKASEATILMIKKLITMKKPHTESGNFLLQSVSSKKISDDNPILMQESLYVELEFASNGDTSNFTEQDANLIIWDKLQELSKEDKTYTETDLVEFGNYLLSEKLVIKNKNNTRKVHQEDIDNFKPKK